MKNMEVKGDFSIIPLVYESELDKEYGMKLSDVKFGDDIPMNGDLEKIVKFRDGVEFSLDEINKHILEKYKSLPGYSAMEFEDMDGLFNNLKILYKIGYNCYAYGKAYGVSPLNRIFPDHCCDRGAKNQGLNSLAAGYHNTTMVNNQEKNHCYLEFPFHLKKEGLVGFVTVDPTSDQGYLDGDFVEGSKRTPPRNYISVSFGKKWSYERRGGIEYFPSDKSGFTNLDVLRNYPNKKLSLSPLWDKYFSEVFKNPVPVKLSF